VTWSQVAVSADLPTGVVVLSFVLAALGLALLLFELSRRDSGGRAIVATGLLAVLALLLAVLRPVRVRAKESSVGARVVVLADVSRSMALEAGNKTRAAVRDTAVKALLARGKDARMTVLGFGEGAPIPFELGAPGGSATARASDLTAAITALANAAEERPRALVVVSDGRLSDPLEGESKASLTLLAKKLDVPIHVVATTHDAPADASIRRVAAAGAAVAHVPLSLRVQVGCAGGLSCDEITVTARELREDGPPAVLATGVVHVKDGIGEIDLTVTLERAGARIVEVSLEPPFGDTIRENDRRLLTFDVSRERVRVLHVAGRPTTDVRALREWLKSDASVDVVAFFILRTPTDDPHATNDELALIPFPVDELFTEYLPTFDAVVLQDFDAQPYGLEKHLPALARYVRAGGGLIMVGGPNSFIGGGYAGSALGNAAGVLPVVLDSSPHATASDATSFEPKWTSEGAAAPLLAPLRAVVGEELPSMPGANVLGDARAGSVVLWTHPSRTTPSGAPMPVLAVGEVGDGRTIAMGIDGGFRLELSGLGARTAGRGYGALWSGLLGWLMRDPRFEPAQLDFGSACVAGVPLSVRMRTTPGSRESRPAALKLDIAPLGGGAGSAGSSGAAGHVHREVVAGPTGSTEVSLPPLPEGAYVARLSIDAGGSTRKELACEVGGDEWADSRPSPETLRGIANASGGSFVWADGDLGAIVLPPPTTVSAERHVSAVVPPWGWTALATALLGVHWLVRRRAGLA
jgi:uncharacterized membrane protein